jgi:hypothetical protein
MMQVELEEENKRNSKKKERGPKKTKALSSHVWWV